MRPPMTTRTGAIVRRLPEAALGALALVALMLLSGVAGIGSATPAAPGAPSAGHATLVPAGAAASPSAPAIPTPPSSARGTFFTSAGMPFPSANQTCLSGFYCRDVSNDPSLTRSPDGTLAVAYTLWTDAAPCGNVTRWAQSEIAVSTSTDNGTTWSTPKILGNQDCSHASTWPSAWQPSIASLGNGTLVLAFIEFNLSAYRYVNNGVLFGGPYTPHTVTNASLVVSESYNNGTNWTVPLVLNLSSSPHHTPGFTPERPWVTTYGQTIYLTWMNLTNASMYNYSSAKGYGSSQVHLLVSTNGGSSWAPQIDLTSFRQGSGPAIGENPYVTTTSSGEVLISYLTNATYYFRFPNGCSICMYYQYTADIELAASTNNGTSFTYSTIASNVVASAAPYSYPSYNIAPYYSFSPVSPQIASNPVNGQIYATWSEVPQYSYVCATYCYYLYVPFDMFTNSSDGGATWSAAHVVDPSLTLASGEMEYNPSFAVDGSGTIQYITTYVQLFTGAGCYTTYWCPTHELYLNSTDNGTTFNAPILVSYNGTAYAADLAYKYAPDGEYSSVVASGNRFWFGWTDNTCSAGATAYCYFPYSSTSLVSQVTVSSLYTGQGLTVQFNETGLVNGTAWSLSLMGNPRAGVAPNSLVFTGVPSSTTLGWTFDQVNGGYGIRYFPASSLSSPSSFASNTTIWENFSEQILVNVTTNPQYAAGNPYCSSWPCWNYYYGPEINYNVTPAPGAIWVNKGTSFTESVTPNPAWCPYSFYCYDQWVNLTFQSWTGSGLGSITATGMNISWTANGPVNETANFQVNGYCLKTSATGPVTCTDLNQTLMFDESGLPSGTTWDVTLFGYQGQTVTASSNTSTLMVQSAATLGVVSYVIWTIPTTTPGTYWIGTGTPVSPILLPGERIVNVTFAQGSPSSTRFWTQFDPSGLPNGTAWSLKVDSSSVGIENGTYNTTLAGGSHTIGAPDVYGTGGTSYYASSITYSPFIVGASNVTYRTVPASVPLNGSGLVTVSYSPEYWLSVATSSGGTATPSSEWVHSGSAVTLNATALAGYSFVGWTGSGSGSTTTTTPNPTIHPTGAVTELATFAPTPPARWNITVSTTGLPAGVDAQVTVGDLSYSGTGSFVVGGLLSGDYAVNVAYVYSNLTDGVRYVPTGWTTSFTQPVQGTIAVASDGTLDVTFEEQDLVAIASTGSGTVAPAPGQYWYANGATVSLTATPDPHYKLSGWMGAVNSTTLAITLTVNGPLSETAQFVWKPTPPPRTFNLTVTETGLPSGTAWNLSLGATGGSSSSGSMTISGLNGTYTAVVPIVYAGTGTRYVANTSGPYSESVNVTANGSLSVTFTKEYLLSVSTTVGGNVSTSSQWVTAGTSVTLAATPANASWVFASWNGTTQSNATSLSVTVNGPTSEQAVFSPVYPVQKTGSATAGQSTAILLFVVLLVAALVIGLLVGRRRAPRAPVQEYSTGEAGAEGEAPPEESSVPGPAAEYDESQTSPAEYDESRP